MEYRISIFYGYLCGYLMIHIAEEFTQYLVLHPVRIAPFFHHTPQAVFPLHIVDSSKMVHETFPPLWADKAHSFFSSVLSSKVCFLILFFPNSSQDHWNELFSSFLCLFLFHEVSVSSFFFIFLKSFWKATPSSRILTAVTSGMVNTAGPCYMNDYKSWATVAEFRREQFLSLLFRPVAIFGVNSLKG